MFGSDCDLKIHIQNLGYRLTLKIGAPETTFYRRLRSLTANLTASVFRTKHDVLHKLHNRTSALEFGNYNGPTTSFQNVMNFGTQTA